MARSCSVDHVISAATGRNQKELDDKVRTAVRFKKFLVDQHVPLALTSVIGLFVYVPHCWSPQDQKAIDGTNNRLSVRPGQQRVHHTVTLELLGYKKGESADVVCVASPYKLDVFSIVTPSKNSWLVGRTEDFHLLKFL